MDYNYILLFPHFIFTLWTLALIRPDFRTFQYSSRAKIPIHHGARTDRTGRIDRKQAYRLAMGGELVQLLAKMKVAKN